MIMMLLWKTLATFVKYTFHNMVSKPCELESMRFKGSYGYIVTILYFQFRPCACFVFDFVDYTAIGNRMREKQYYDSIHSVRNLETACCAAWHSHRKNQYEYFREFGYQTEDKHHGVLSGHWLCWSCTTIHHHTRTRTQHGGLL